MPITRRRLLAHATSLAATTLAPAASLHPTQDPELTALGARFEQALAVLEVAQPALAACERRYLEEGPLPPPVLTDGGPLGHLINDWGCWTALELHSFLEDESNRADWPAARLALPVALAYEARDLRFRRKLGVPAAECAHEAALDAVESLGDAILAASARSAHGLAVQGRAVKVWGKPE